MSVDIDSNDRKLSVGDPVTLLGGLARRGWPTGKGSHGAVKSFGSVYVHVLISNGRKFIDDGDVVQVLGDKLAYGHFDISEAEQVARDQQELEFKAGIEARERRRAQLAVLDFIYLAAERSIVTKEQLDAMLALGDEEGMTPPK
ncbi:hypothetical protein [Nocardia sp. R6R-6]|uniref:hypothetical protein n=1 Tax=Nocardia sp. R6R-6 TaxID=3459303 RepID=UPI00403D9989